MRPGGRPCCVCVIALLIVASTPARSELATAPSGTVEEIVVQGRADSLLGIADSASMGTVGARQLERRPLARPGEVLETVPGVIVTQHSGAGKANQLFLRGFNLDHGTDFATSIDGVPVNLPSHGHGQGYTDLNFVIPELLQRVNFRKGVYYPDQGDFSSTGAADLQYFRALPTAIVQLEAGRWSHMRGLIASSTEFGGGNLLYGLELLHNDGPWRHPDGFKKANGVLRYSQGDDGRGWSLTASAYAGEWDATDQIARRALETPGFDRFDTLDPSDGGDSRKFMLYGAWHHVTSTSASRILAYGFRQSLDLFSNFSYVLASPQGDQFEQIDRRWVGGTKASHTRFGTVFGLPLETTVGIEVRSDRIGNGLFQTLARHRTDKLDYAGGIVPATTRRDDIWEVSVAPYFESSIRWAEKIRSLFGVRVDWFHFDVKGDIVEDSGRQSDAIASPKGSIILGPWAATELYLSGGLGFHSNDARGVVASENPADPLVRTYGAEIGIRYTGIPGLQSTLALWWLRLDSELVFVGDAGTTEAGRPSRRYGVELTNYYEATPWMTLDADISISRARFRDNDPAGHQIPGSVESVVAAGATVHDLGGVFGALRLRYFGPRPLVEGGSVRSDGTLLVSARLGHHIGRTWTLSAEIFNLLNRKDSEIDYFYPSRLPGEPPGPADGGTNDVHFHPVDPISFRIALTARF